MSFFPRLIKKAPTFSHRKIFIVVEGIELEGSRAYDKLDIPNLTFGYFKDKYESEK